jgi:hypothetical protein
MNRWEYDGSDGQNRKLIHLEFNFHDGEDIANEAVDFWGRMAATNLVVVQN